MGEIKVTDNVEIKNPDNEKYKDIKPESEITRQDAKGFWDNKFKQTDGVIYNNMELKENGDLAKSIKEYIDDLKAKSDYPDSIKDNCIDISKLDRVSPEEVVKMREEFEDNKSKLRKAWEELTGHEWPKYKEDVYNSDGVLIRKAGMNLDAHHEQPLCLGGKNDASNITPLDVTKHKEVHSKTGSCTNMINAYEGGR